MSLDENSLDSLLEGFNTFKLNTPVRKTAAGRPVLGERKPSADNNLQESADLAQPAETKAVGDLAAEKGLELITEKVEATSADKASVRGADPFENIRELDENERWTDRNWVITAPQHQENLKLVSQTLGDIIEKLPIGERGDSSADNLTQGLEVDTDASPPGQDLPAAAGGQIVELPQLPAVSLLGEDIQLDPFAATPTTSTPFSAADPITGEETTAVTTEDSHQQSTPVEITRSEDPVPEVTDSGKLLDGTFDTPYQSDSTSVTGSQSTNILDLSFNKTPTSTGAVAAESSQEFQGSTSVAGLEDLLTGLDISDQASTDKPEAGTEIPADPEPATSSSASPKPPKSETKEAEILQEESKEELNSATIGTEALIPTEQTSEDIPDTDSLAQTEPESDTKEEQGEDNSATDTPRQLDQTFEATPDTDSSAQTGAQTETGNKEEQSLDNTAADVPVPLDQTFETIPDHSTGLNQTFDTVSDKAPELNKTFDTATEPAESAAPLDQTFDLEPAVGEEPNSQLNATFDLANAASEPENKLNSTFNCDNTTPDLNATFDKADSKSVLNETIEISAAVPELNATFDKANGQTELNKTVDLTAAPDLNETFDKTVDTTSGTQEGNNSTLLLNKTFDSTAVSEENQTILENQTVVAADPVATESLLNSTFDKTAVVEEGEIKPVEAEIVQSDQKEIIEQEEITSETSPDSLASAATPISVEDQPIKTNNTSEENKPIKSDNILIEDQPIKTSNTLLEDQPIKTNYTSLEDQPIKTKISDPAPAANMGDEDDIPIPKGAYTINWDEIDEFADPFAMSKPPGSGKSMANSPPIRSNANPPRFDPTPEPTAAPSADTGASGNPPDITASTQSAPDVTPEATNSESAPAATPPKKKTPLKKKKVAGKSGGPSKFAAFKKKQAANLQNGEAEGNGPDLTIEIPKPDNIALPDLPTNNGEDDGPVPPPVAYPDFENCVDPFASKANAMMNSPPIKAQAPPPDFDNMADPFGTKSKVQLSPPVKAQAPPPDFDDMADPFGTKSKVQLSPPAKAQAPPPNFDDMADPFGTKSNVQLSPPAKTQAPPPNFDDMADPFGTKSKVALSPVDTKPPVDFTDAQEKPEVPNSLPVDEQPAEINKIPSESEANADPFQTKSKVPLSPTKPSFDPESIDDPFKSTNKMANSPSTEQAPDLDVDPFKPRKNMMANSPPSTPKTLAVSSSAAGGDNNKVNAPTSPFLSSAELASPTALQGTSAIGDIQRGDSPGGRGDHSTATTTSQDEEFVDAVDDLPKEELFQAAHPDMFNTTADIGILDRAARSNTNFKESALARQSLYRKFDPLVDSDSPKPLAPLSEQNPDKSVCLIGDTFIDTPKGKTSARSVDALLDITVSSPSVNNKTGPLVFSQNDMDDKDQIIQQMKLDYEAQLLAKDREWDRKLQSTGGELRSQGDLLSQLQEKLRLAEENTSKYAKTLDDLLSEKEKLANVSEDELSRIKSERDTAAEDFQKIDISFSDLHRRYDKIRESVIHLKQNEASLQQQLQEKNSEIKSSFNQFENLKSEYQSKLSDHMTEMERLKGDKQGELTKLTMAKRKAELSVNSLQQQLAQKNDECDELTKICDNLIQIKGSS